MRMKEGRWPGFCSRGPVGRAIDRKYTRFLCASPRRGYGRSRRRLIPVINKLPNRDDSQNDGDPRDDLAGERRLAWRHPALLGKRVDALGQGEIEVSQAALAVG